MMKEYVVTLKTHNKEQTKTVKAASEESALNKAFPKRGWHWEEWDKQSISMMGRAVIGDRWYFLQDNG